MNAFPWTIFFILIAAGILGTAAVLPYSLSMNADVMQKLKVATSGAPAADGQPARKAKLRLPMPVLFLVSVLQSGVLVAVLSFVGLLAARQVGLGMPILQSVIAGRPVADQILSFALLAVVLGAGSGVLMLALEAVYFMPRIPRKVANLDHRTAFWKRALACFYGGVVEEVISRLFTMSVLVWLIGLVWKNAAGAPALGAFWLANLLAAALFGLGHLPGTARLAHLTPLIIFRAVLLNGIIGVACGWLFMVYGLEAAMLAHFSVDIVLHLVAVPVMQRVTRSLPSEPAPQAA